MAQRTDSSDISPIEPDISPIPRTVSISSPSSETPPPLPNSDKSSPSSSLDLLQIPSPLSLSPPLLPDSLQKLPLQPLHLRVNPSDSPFSSDMACAKTTSPPLCSSPTSSVSLSVVEDRITAPHSQPLTTTTVKRCRSCRKRVGLLGFKCRCGDTFCASHRYSDLHNCSFDYKSAGRAAIARENPVVTASKIVKI